jgi:hypothetical protein
MISSGAESGSFGHSIQIFFEGQREGSPSHGEVGTYELGETWTPRSSGTQRSIPYPPYPVGALLGKIIMNWPPVRWCRSARCVRKTGDFRDALMRVCTFRAVGR